MNERLPKVVLSSVRSDRSLQTQGDWKVVPDWPGVRLHVRGLNYPPYKFALTELNAELARKHTGKPATPEELQQREDERYRRHGEILADHILLGWDGFDQAYDPALARSYLTDPERDLFTYQTIYVAGQVGVGKLEFTKETEKN